jgi:nicotinamidase-related amidase
MPATIGCEAWVWRNACKVIIAIDVAYWPIAAAPVNGSPEINTTCPPSGGYIEQCFQRRFGRQQPQVEGSLMTNPKLEVLTPQNSQVIFIDHQPQMAFGVQSIDRQTLKNNVVGLAKAAKVFKIPTIITTVESQGFSGYTYPELLDVFPDKPVLERTSMNSWDDKKVRDALKANGRNKVVVSGLWVEVCNTSFALSAMLEGGYEIYMVADASGGTSKEAHDYAMQRMIQVGVVPVTWQQVLLEWQRDWARKETYDAVMAIVREHSGAYGMGVDYAYTMVHKAPQRISKVHEVLPPVAA